MKPMRWLAFTSVAVVSLPLIARQTPLNAQQSSSASAEHSSSAVSSAAAVQMQQVRSELQNRLNSKNAKAGDPVIVKTTEKVTTSEGVLLPRGTRLIGHVISAQPQVKGKTGSELAIVFDHAELKGGATIAIHSIIEGVAPSQRSMDLLEEAQTDGSRMSTGPVSATGGMAGDGPGMGQAGVNGSANGTPTGMEGGPFGRAGSGQTMSAADRGELNGNDAASEAARLALGNSTPVSPQATALPGVMLTCGSGISASGVLTSKSSNVDLDFGTRMMLGVAAQK